MHGTLAGQCILIVCFCLGNFQQIFRILNDYQSISFLDRLVFFEIDLLDKSLYAGIDGTQVLFHLRIVCVFYISQMNEFSTYPADSSNQNQCDEKVRDGSFLVFYHRLIVCLVLV